MNIIPPSAIKGRSVASLAVAVSLISSCSPLARPDAATPETPDYTPSAGLQRPDVPSATTQVPEPSPFPPELPSDVPFPIPENGLVLFTNAGSDLATYDPLTGAWNVLSESFWTPYRFSSSGCELLIATKDGNLRWVDLEGHITEYLFEVQSLVRAGQEPFKDTILPSPDFTSIGYWLAFGRPSNEIGFNLRMETQDLFTYAMDLTKGPNPVSTSGGAYVVEWSPNGKAVAFSDYDQSRVHQVFVAAPDGSGSRQLTQFLIPSFFDDYSVDYEGIQSIVWSPAGALLATENLIRGHPQISIRPATATTSPLARLDLQDAHILWWIDSQALLFSSRDGIHKADLATGTTALLLEMPAFEVVAGRFLPLAGTHRGLFMIGPDMYLFDIDLSAWGLLGKVPDPTYWPILSAPPDFEGTASCP